MLLIIFIQFLVYPITCCPTPGAKRPSVNSLPKTYVVDHMVTVCMKHKLLVIPAKTVTIFIVITHTHKTLIQRTYLPRTYKLNNTSTYFSHSTVIRYRTSRKPKILYCVFLHNPKAGRMQSRGSLLHLNTKIDMVVMIYVPCKRYSHFGVGW